MFCFGLFGVFLRGMSVTARGVVQRRDRQKKEFHDQSDYR